jgi:hypothetical protein
MKWTPNFKALKLDVAAYQAALSRYMQDWIKQAAQRWLQATVISIIPTWSKASRATFQALARDVGMSIPYGPQQSRKDREALGLSTGSGGLELDPSASRWYFRYRSSLRYLAYNEYNRAVWGPEPPAPFRRAGLIHPTPYHFQEAGQKEFEEFAHFTVLPNPYKFLKTEKVK